MSDGAHWSREGSEFGKYRLRQLLGRGPHGEVYDAEDTTRQRAVALKLMSAALSSDPAFRRRMQHEARVVGQLQEPHVVQIHECGQIDDVFYIDMALIGGPNLSAVLQREGPLAPQRAVNVVSQVAAALEDANAAGVLHQDVKPENILLTENDFAHVVDFGMGGRIAESQTTPTSNTAALWKYTAPEFFGDEDLTYRGDIYSLAAVLYECLTGCAPYPNATTSTALITAHLNQPVPRASMLRPGLPAGFDEVIARGMAKDPAERYASAGDLARAAQGALSGQDLPTSTQGQSFPPAAPDQPTYSFPPA